ARLAVRNLVPSPTNENETAVKENDRSENWSDEPGARKSGCSIAEPVLNVARPVDHRDGHGKAKPKLVAEHADRVSGMTILTVCRTTGAAASAMVSHVRVGSLRRVVAVPTPIVGRMARPVDQSSVQQGPWHRHDEENWFEDKLVNRGANHAADDGSSA